MERGGGGGAQGAGGQEAAKRDPQAHAVGKKARTGGRRSHRPCRASFPSRGHCRARHVHQPRSRHCRSTTTPRPPSRSTTAINPSGRLSTAIGGPSTVRNDCIPSAITCAISPSGRFSTASGGPPSTARSGRGPSATTCGRRQPRSGICHWNSRGLYLYWGICGGEICGGEIRGDPWRR